MAMRSWSTPPAKRRKATAPSKPLRRNAAASAMRSQRTATSRQAMATCRRSRRTATTGAVAGSIAGTVLAPVPYAGAQLWIVFQNVDGVSVIGGTLDGRGQAYWACRRAGGGSSCPAATRASTGVAIVDTVGSGPGGSPNTDGIHIKQSSDITIRNAVVGTGDDCISMVEGSSDVWIQGVTCGPGHGISLGDTPEQVAVRNITVKAVTLAGTTNGLRIKSWAKANSGLVDGVAFSDVVMRNVRNPIIVDQNYCPGNVSCPTEGSGIKITNVSYTDVEGTSATPVAVRFNCSPSQPCTGITMRNKLLKCLRFLLWKLDKITHLLKI
ncbi:Polygalacturonase [Triticum urartu]|uniref:Polygalacturonase n=1 Tax=Triticum urartu TaxID=4572 RepID=M7Z183_TRIUA|nr:Polygalacturonase [Triticum urartu]